VLFIAFVRVGYIITSCPVSDIQMSGVCGQDCDVIILWTDLRQIWNIASLSVPYTVALVKIFQQCERKY